MGFNPFRPQSTSPAEMVAFVLALAATVGVLAWALSGR